MNIIKLLLKEIRFRKVPFGLSLLAITAASTLFVAGPTMIDGYREETSRLVGEAQARMRRELARLEEEIAGELSKLDDETRKLMRDMGFNLMIVHRDTDMTDFWSSDFSTVDMPQDYVQRLANARGLTLVTHLVATLQQKIEWEGRKALLVAYLPEATQAHMRKKSPMGYNIEPGAVYLGHELGRSHSEGDAVEVLGERFKIARILPEKGSKEDITIAMNLADGQRLLEKPGKVNQILALGCHCAGSRLAKIRSQLEQVLPETKITEFRSIAIARAEQRDLVRDEGQLLLEKTRAEHRGSLERLEHSRTTEEQRIEALVSITTPLVIAVSALWVGLLALGNVRDRRSEIGLLRALGVGSTRIGALFLGKAAVLGLAGGGIGLAAGAVLARALGTSALSIPADRLVVDPVILVATLLGAPLVSALASYLPTLAAVVEDPAVVLRVE